MATTKVLHGRRGLYWTDDGYIVERDEAYPTLNAWLVSGPGIGTGQPQSTLFAAVETETVLGLTAARRLVAHARKKCAGCA